LFVVLAGLYAEHTGDIETLRELWPNIEAALNWIDGPGDPDHDGFVEYHRANDMGLIVLVRHFTPHVHSSQPRSEALRLGAGLNDLGALVLVGVRHMRRQVTALFVAIVWSHMLT
jgi:hypothetical protein